MNKMYKTIPKVCLKNINIVKHLKKYLIEVFGKAGKKIN